MEPSSFTGTSTTSSLGFPKGQHQVYAVMLRIKPQEPSNLRPHAAANHTATISLFRGSQHDGLGRDSIVPLFVFPDRQVTGNDDIG